MEMLLGVSMKVQVFHDRFHLQNLAKLKYLWLEENPCVDSAGPQ
jgi:hypothetical protein